jgi:environmental stress-induced protein Ves
MVRLLKPADYRSTPWKNGGGTTTEIATHPTGAALDDFTWRVSVAEVDRDGPFSLFPGIDRTIVLLEGAGMRLTGGGREATLRTPFEPHSFAGDDAVDCALVAGPIRDFNAMFRRDRAHGTIAVVRGGGAEIAPTEFRLAFAARGAHEYVIPGRPPDRLASGHALLVEPASGIEAKSIAIRPLTVDAVALVVSIDCP